MIEQALTAYLTNPDQDSQRADRRDARDKFREYVGTNINIGRRPRNNEVNYGVTVLRVSDERYDDINEEAELATPVIQIDVWGKGQDAAATVLMIGEQYLRTALSNYHGQMGDVFVRGCTLERGIMQSSTQPADKSERWSHRFSSDYRITHDQPIVAGGT